jgi:hypothetical protein
VFSSKSHQREEQKERSGGKTEWKLSKVNTRAVSRGQYKLIGELKMVVDDVISIRGQVMKHT